MPRMAFERALIIVGEAISQLAKIPPEIAGQPEEFRRIIAFRNILIHAYAEVDDRIVRDVMQKKIPVLAATIARLLRNGKKTAENPSPRTALPRVAASKVETP